MAKKSEQSVKNSSSFTVRDLVNWIERKAPSACAEKGDNVGLLVGNEKAKVSGAVISIDLTSESISLATERGYNLIINHHPCIFPRARGLAKVTAEGQSSLVYEASRRGIQVIAAHTNFDVCALEVPLAITSGLEAVPLGRLMDRENEPPLLKLVVFVPPSHLEAVRTAISAAGAGEIGNYDSCTFATPGTGTFRGNVRTHPAVGRPGVLEQTPEVRLETVFPKGLKARVLSALRAAHPYEEIAYDLYSLTQRPSGLGMISGLGYGFFGELKTPTNLESLLKRVESTFKTRGYLLTESIATPTGKSRPRKPGSGNIKRIGFTPGKGSAFVSAALDAGCELFITGEVGYHSAREAAAEGMSVMEIGHAESEYFYLQTLAQWMKEWGVPHAVLRTPTQRFRGSDP